MENKASLENYIIIFASFSFILFYFLPGFSFQNLVSFVESVVSYGNPVTNLNIIFITISIIIIVEFVRFLVFFIKIIINDPFPYGMYYSSSSDDD